MGFESVQAASAREGLAAAERLITLTVAFVDVGLPDRSGMELARDLRSRWPELRIAIATGYGRQAVGKFANDSRVMSLPKPFDTIALAAAIERLGLTSRPSTKRMFSTREIDRPIPRQCDRKGAAQVTP